MYADWRTVPIPSRLANRPRDARGYPIPALALIDRTGKPDFRVTDMDKWVAACRNKTCSLCGEPLGRHLAFIGGPLSFENRYFTDLPAHRECAEYALRVCPYIAAPNFKYAESIRVDADVTVRVSPEVLDARPDRFFLGITKSCTPVRTDGDTMLVRASPWEQVSWWNEGQCIEPLHAV